MKKEVDKIAEVAGYLWQNGWAERNGGNINVNITDLVDDEIKALNNIEIDDVPLRVKKSHTMQQLVKLINRLFPDKVE